MPRITSSCAFGGFSPLFCRPAGRRLAGLLACGVLMVAAAAAQARGTYMTVAEFLENSFPGQTPSLQTLWLSGDVQQRLERIFGHPYKSMRVRYWQHEDKTAWVLEEIGKEMPITMGVAVERGVIEQMRILVYRESRGGEVRHPFFTDQFVGATLEADDALDRRIDGITGATLSVRAVTRVAEAALVLSALVTES